MADEKTFTQEELNNIIGERLKKYADYDELKTKVGGYEQQITDLNAAHEKALAEKDKQIADANASHETQVNGLNAKIAEYETNSVKMRVAIEAGLPAELADRLQGTDEASFRADAQKLIGFAKPPMAPQYNPEPAVETDPKKAALMKMLQNMTKT